MEDKTYELLNNMHEDIQHGFNTMHEEMQQSFKTVNEKIDGLLDELALKGEEFLKNKGYKAYALTKERVSVPDNSILPFLD